MRTDISGAVRVRSWARSMKQLFGAELVAEAEVVAEAVGGLLERGEGVDVGELLRGVGAAGGEGDGDVEAGLLGGVFDGCGAGEDDEVGEETLLPLPFWAEVKSAWIFSSVERTLARTCGWLTSQFFCGSRRMRAPLAPPRLSEPRKVAAAAQAVETSCEVVRPEARICFLSSAISASPMSARDRRRGRGPAR